MDKLSLVISLYAILRIIYLFHMRQLAVIDLPSMTDTQAIDWVRASIYIDFFVWVVGGLAGNMVVASMVEIAGVANLYEPIKIRQKIVDPIRILRVIRVVYILVSFTFFSLWAFIGIVSDLGQYRLWRRACYLLTTFLCFFISGPLLYFFGSRVVKALKAKIDSELDDKSTVRSPTIKMTRTSSLQSSGILSGSSSGQLPDLREQPKKKDARERQWHQVNVLETSVYSILFILYGGSGLYTIAYVLGFELYQDDTVLLHFKIGCNFALLICTNFFAVFLFYNDWYKSKYEPSSKSNSRK
ncbi:hypothetical protein EDD86DRAFT_273240 [Gorgonomyces haynaldii]|nr:hypothetical protein EDD86DRAFT_273240 [Gorgonomyces haynaldii]